MRLARFIAAGLLCAAFPSIAVAQDCTAPAPVCDARDAVFAISAFDPVASAVRVDDDLLVTNRHVLADMDEVIVFLPDGSRLAGTPIPSDMHIDLQLVSVPGLPDGPMLTIAAATAAETLYTVGADISQGRIRAYDPGSVTLLPSADHPRARLHHSAFSQPGNSGGALLDADGHLVGIIASGGEGRHEAVPSSRIAALRARSGDEHADINAETGAAIRVCTTLLDNLRRSREAMADEQAQALETSCTRTGNRQYFDNAAQTLAQQGRTVQALDLFTASLDADPHALNTRLSLIITLHTLGRFEEELEHLRFLNAHIPNDPQVIRFAIQAGVWGGDMAMAEAALERLAAINPNLATRAEAFIADPPARPPRR